MYSIESYNKALNDLYEHVGFTPDWVVYPIKDCTDMLWKIEDGIVLYAENMKDFDSGDHYEVLIYPQRFYKKHIYAGSKYTLIFCDPRTDGVKWFKIFSNQLIVD